MLELFFLNSFVGLGSLGFGFNGGLSEFSGLGPGSHLGADRFARFAQQVLAACWKCPGRSS